MLRGRPPLSTQKGLTSYQALQAHHESFGPGRRFGPMQRGRERGDATRSEGAAGRPAGFLPEGPESSAD